MGLSAEARVLGLLGDRVVSFYRVHLRTGGLGRSAVLGPYLTMEEVVAVCRVLRDGGSRVVRVQKVEVSSSVVWDA